MAIDTGEIELHTASLAAEKFAQESPQTLLWLLHNFSVIAGALQTGATSDDVTEIQDAITAAQAAVAAIQAAVDAIVIPAPFDPSGLQGQIDDLQDQIDAIPPPTPPHVYPPGTNGQVLTHGNLADEVFFADPGTVGASLIYAPGQTGVLVTIHDSTPDEAILPEFVLMPDGQIVMVAL